MPTQPCSSTVRASVFEAEGWWCKPTRGCQFHAHVVQCRDNRLRSGPVRVRVLPWAPFQNLRSSVERVADYESAGRRCESCRRHHFKAPVAQCIEHRASNAEAGGESPSGSATSSWNANRTSVPGLVANKIVPPPCGMRSMSSTFRHSSHPHSHPYET